MPTTLFLMQHGEATSEQEDPERPLTSGGRAAVERVAARTAAAGVSIARCYHSGKRRAEQSAQLLAAALAASVEQRDGLAPNDPVEPVAQWVRRADAPIALVGHLPFLDRLAALLVAGDEHAGVVQFAMGGLVCLAPDAAGERFAIAWAITPEMA